MKRIVFKESDSFLDRAKTVWNQPAPVARKAALVWNWLAWEGGIQWSEDRGRVGFSYHIQEPNEANDSCSREEIIRKAHEFERNVPIVNKAKEVFVQYVVGPNGMPIIPASSDEDWNARIKPRWEEFCAAPDLTSDLSLAGLQALAAGRWFIDGHGYFLATRTDERPFKPRIQFIEAARVKTPSSLIDRADVIDGVQVDKRGKALFYFVEEKSGVESVFKKYPAFGSPGAIGGIIPLQFPSRPGELRPFSFLAPVLNVTQDLKELRSFAMKRAKDLTAISLVFKTESGEMPSSEDVVADNFSVGTKTATGTEITKDRRMEIEKKTGSKLISTRINEDIKQLSSGSPNEFDQAHWEILTNDFCAGCGISKLLIFPWSIQGTVVRAELDNANGFFRGHAAIMVEVLTKLFRFWVEQTTGYATGMDAALADRPSDYYRCKIRFPRAVNVDIGRNSSAMLAELAAGATNYDLIYGPLGLDADEELKSGIKYLAKILKWCGDEKVPIDMFNKAFASAVSEGEQLKQKLEAFGVGVRAGAITPSREDEEFFRESAGLPAMSEEVVERWEEEDGTRRPITLTAPDGTRAAPNQAALATEDAA